MSFKVLVVDDSKLARMAIAKALKSLRPEWIRIEASSADEALALTTVEDIDIALLDFNMPGRDGLALAADLREMKPAMPIAVITANLQHEIVARAEGVGAAFLPKPLNEEALDGFLQIAERRLEASQA